MISNARISKDDFVKLFNLIMTLQASLGKPSGAGPILIQLKIASTKESCSYQMFAMLSMLHSIGGKYVTLLLLLLFLIVRSPKKSAWYNKV